MSSQPPPVLIPQGMKRSADIANYLEKQKNALWQLWENKAVFAESTPASASATGKKGTIAWDDDYIYVCVDTDTWKRVSIGTW